MKNDELQCMQINVWIHHMHVDPLFDFLNGRIKEAPDYYLNADAVPHSITGGYVMVSLPFESYSLLTSHKDWEASGGWMT